MPNNKNKSIGQTNNYPPKPSCSFFGQSTTQVSPEYMVLIFKEPSLNAVMVVSPSQPELFTQCSNVCEKKGSLTLVRVIPSLAVLNGNTISSLMPENQSLTILSGSSTDSQSGNLDDCELSGPTLGSELFFTKWLTPLLMPWLGPDEQGLVGDNAERLRQIRRKGYPRWYLVVWDGSNFLRLLWYCLIGLLEDVANIIKMVADALKIIDIKP